MFEVFGPLAKPTLSLLPLLLVLWPLVGALACLGDDRRARARAVAVCAVGALAAATVLVGGTRWPSEQRFLLRHLGIAARVGQLELVLALVLDPLAAFASTVAFALMALLVAAQGRTDGARRRIALLCVMGCAVEVAVMADGVTTLVVGAAMSSLVGAALGRVRGAWFASDRVAEIALVAAAAIMFWTLGGSWIDDQYVPELDARVVVASDTAQSAHTRPDADDEDEDDQARTPRSASTRTLGRGRATLSLTSLPGAAVLVDGVWLRSRTIVRAPFTDAPISAGQHTVRVHAGAGSDDYYIPRLGAADGDHVALALHGATTTFREMADELGRGDGTRDSRSMIARRRFFSGSAAGWVFVLALVAFVARGRLFPFSAPSDGEPARALGAVATLMIAARYSFAELSPRTAAVVAGVLATSSVMAFAGTLRRGHSRAWLTGELGLAGVGFAAGAPALAILHGGVAALLSTARPRALEHPTAGLLLFPTRIAIVGALAGRANGAIPTSLTLASILLAALAWGARSPARIPSRGAVIVVTVLAAIGAALALDPRVVGFGHGGPLAQRLLDPSFRPLGAFAPCAWSLVLLVAAAHAFAWIFSRTHAHDGLAASPLVRTLDAPASVIPRAAAVIASGVAAFLVKLEARAAAAFEELERATVAIGSVLVACDDATTALTGPRTKAPSMRAARLLLVPLALATAALFVVPWLS